MSSKNIHMKTFFNIRLDVLVCLSLVIATLAVYWQVKNHEFVNFDDQTFIPLDHSVKGGLSWESITFIFTKPDNALRILPMLSHMLDCELFGLAPGWHHLTNLLFHIANTVLLFITLKRMTGALWKSAFVAALFALHPLNVESVAWVAERRNVLSTFFWILTMFTYARYAERPGLYRYLLVLLVFLLGLMAKPMIVTLPFVLLLLDYWPLTRVRLNQSGNNGNLQLQKTESPDYQRSALVPRLILEKLPFIALTIPVSLFTILIVRRVGAMASFELLPLKLRFANTLVSYVSYIGKMFWPQNLAVFYPYPTEMPPMWQTAGAGFFLVCVSVLVIREFRRIPCLGVGWLWYIGTLVPVIGLVQAGGQAMADRYAYVPLIGLFIMIAWGVPELVARWRYKKMALITIAAVLISMLMAVTWLQIRYWANSITLFQHALDVTANNYLAHNNLGVALQDEGKIPDAISHYYKALYINPDFDNAHNNLGAALFLKGKVDEAIDHYYVALKLNPNFDKAHNNLGAALFLKGKTDEAIAHFLRALDINPDYGNAKYNLQKALAAQEEVDKAVAKIQNALTRNPRDHTLHYGLGVLYQRKGELDQAIEQYQMALSIQPEFPKALNRLATVLVAKSEYDKAISLYRHIIRLRPHGSGAYYNIACIYAKQNKIEESIKWLKKAIEKGYDNWDLIKTDKDLENIRASSHYKELMKRH